MTWQCQDSSANCKAGRRTREDGLLSTNKGNRAMTTGEDGMGKRYGGTALRGDNSASQGNHGNATVMGNGYTR